MNQDKPINRQPRSRRSRAWLFASFGGVLVVGSALAQVSCAEGGSVSGDTSGTSTAGAGGSTGGST